MKNMGTDIFGFTPKTAGNYAQSVSELDILRKQGAVPGA